MLVQSGHNHVIESNMFSTWYVCSWKIAHLALSNNQSLNSCRKWSCKSTVLDYRNITLLIILLYSKDSFSVNIRSRLLNMWIESVILDYRFYGGNGAESVVFKYCPTKESSFFFFPTTWHIKTRKISQQLCSEINQSKISYTHVYCRNITLRLSFCSDTCESVEYFSQISASFTFEGSFLPLCSSITRCATWTKTKCQI